LLLARSKNDRVLRGLLLHVNFYCNVRTASPAMIPRIEQQQHRRRLFRQQKQQQRRQLLRYRTQHHEWVLEQQM